eukprot:747661-Hanusia_phi.AAC.1
MVLGKREERERVRGRGRKLTQGQQGTEERRDDTGVEGSEGRGGENLLDSLSHPLDSFEIVSHRSLPLRESQPVTTSQTREEMIDLIAEREGRRKDEGEEEGRRGEGRGDEGRGGEGRRWEGR